MNTEKVTEENENFSALDTKNDSENERFHIFSWKTVLAIVVLLGLIVSICTAFGMIAWNININLPIIGLQSSGYKVEKMVCNFDSKIYLFKTSVLGQVESTKFLFTHQTLPNAEDKMELFGDTLYYQEKEENGLIYIKSFNINDENGIASAEPVGLSFKPEENVKFCLSTKGLFYTSANLGRFFDFESKKSTKESLILCGIQNDYIVGSLKLNKDGNFLFYSCVSSTEKKVQIFKKTLGDAADSDKSIFELGGDGWKFIVHPVKPHLFIYNINMSNVYLFDYHTEKVFRDFYCNGSYGNILSVTFSDYYNHVFIITSDLWMQIIYYDQILRQENNSSISFSGSKFQLN